MSQGALANESAARTMPPVWRFTGCNICRGPKARMWAAQRRLCKPRHPAMLVADDVLSVWTPHSRAAMSTPVLLVVAWIMRCAWFWAVCDTRRASE